MPRKAPDGPQEPLENLEKGKGKHGGPRPNSGRPVGSKLLKTITKEQGREALRQIVLEHMRELVAAQVSNAFGIKYLVAREKGSGKFERIGAGGLEAAYARGATIEVWEKDPSTPAFTDLMNRALDKPKEQEVEIKLTGEADMLAALYHGRARAKARKS